MEALHLDIAEMSCGHCVRHVTEALRSLEGVQVGKVEIGAAELAFDPRLVSVDRIEQAVADAGYPAHAAARTA
jgi:copper chaperone